MRKLEKMQTDLDELTFAAYPKQTGQDRELIKKEIFPQPQTQQKSNLPSLRYLTGIQTIVTAIPAIFKVDCTCIFHQTLLPELSQTLDKPTGLPIRTASQPSFTAPVLATVAICITVLHHLSLIDSTGH